MLPPSLLPLLVCALLLITNVARAHWLESGDVDLAVLTAASGFTTQEYVEAEDVEVADRMVLVSVGSGLPGEVTVVGEGDVTTRKVLGNFYVYEGVGNIQSVIGTVNVLRVGTRAGAGTIGVVNVLNSDLEGSGLQVLNGTANVTASDLPGVSLSEGSALYATMGARLRNLTTQENTHTSIQGSIVSTTNPCQLWSTVLFEDSALHCREIQIDNPGTDTTIVDIRAVAVPSVSVEATEEFVVNGGIVDVENAVVTTGMLEVGGVDSYVGIAASRWTNAGGTTVQPSGTVGPVRLVIGAGTEFHELADVRVAGHPAWQHLTVNGTGTELEIDGDLRIGETENHLGNPVDFNGNVTISNGATLIVHGELLMRPQGVLTIESGATVYAASVAGAGTITENGGTLVVPEPGETLGGGVALVAIAWRSRRAGGSGPHTARCPGSV